MNIDPIDYDTTSQEFTSILSKFLFNNNTAKRSIAVGNQTKYDNDINKETIV